MSNVYQHRVQVVAADIDVQGHVNNLVYLKWMQDAAVAHSLNKGWGQSEYDSMQCGWVVRSHQIEYRWRRSMRTRWWCSTGRATGTM